MLAPLRCKCPDMKRVLLLFKQDTPIKTVEDYYGLSVFMLACHACQLSVEGERLSKMPESEIPTTVQLLRAIEACNKATRLNPRLSDVFSVLLDGAPVTRGRVNTMVFASSSAAAVRCTP